MRVLLAAAAAAFAMSAAAAEPPPLQAYARLPALSSPAISPDGKHIAYLADLGAERRIIVEPVAGGRPVSLDPGRRKPRRLLWAGPRHVLVIASSHFAGVPGLLPPQEMAQAFSLDIVERKAVLLMKGIDRAANILNSDPVVMAHEGQPRVFVEGFDVGEEYGFSLYRNSPETGQATLVDKGTLESLEWVVRPSGELLAKTERSRARDRWVLKVRRGGGWAELMALDDPQKPPRLWGLGRDGVSLLVSGDAAGGSGVHEVSPETGAWTASLVPAGVQAERLFHDPRSGRLLGLGLGGAEPELLAFDPALQLAWASVQRTFAGQAPVLMDLTEDKRTLVVAVDPPDKVPAFYRFDLEARRAELIGEAWPDLGKLGPTRAVTVAASDGRSIPAYLTTPPGREGKALPVVVLASDGWAGTRQFDWWTQALASRGYAVLRVNYRGVRGLGPEHQEAGYGEFGRRMQTDLSDAVRQLAAEGAIDPARVCIAGLGWGGYAAVAGVTVQQGVYRCAVAVNGLIDLPRNLDQVDDSVGASGELGTAEWRRYLGVRHHRDPKLAEITPLRHAQRGTAPVLLVHAEQDTTYDTGNSRAMHRQLQAAGRRSELVLIPAEDHWLSTPEGRLRMLEEMLRFLARENPA